MGKLALSISVSCASQNPAINLVVECGYLPAANQRRENELDENVLDQVFEKLEYEDNDDDIKVEDVDYDYDYEDEDQSTIPGKAGRDYPVYDDVPNTQFSCKGETL